MSVSDEKMAEPCPVPLMRWRRAVAALHSTTATLHHIERSAPGYGVLYRHRLLVHPGGLFPSLRWPRQKTACGLFWCGVRGKSHLRFPGVRVTVLRLRGRERRAQMRNSASAPSQVVATIQLYTTVGISMVDQCMLQSLNRMRSSIYKKGSALFHDVQRAHPRSWAPNRDHPPPS